MTTSGLGGGANPFGNRGPDLIETIRLENAAGSAHLGARAPLPEHCLPCTAARSGVGPRSRLAGALRRLRHPICRASASTAHVYCAHLLG